MSQCKSHRVTVGSGFVSAEGRSRCCHLNSFRKSSGKAGTAQTCSYLCRAHETDTSVGQGGSSGWDTPFSVAVIASCSLSSCSPPQNLAPEKIFHVVVAPCYDKKLEALREGLSPTLNGARGTDCVLTSGER